MTRSSHSDDTNHKSLATTEGVTPSDVTVVDATDKTTTDGNEVPSNSTAPSMATDDETPLGSTTHTLPIESQPVEGEFSDLPTDFEGLQKDTVPPPPVKPLWQRYWWVALLLIALAFAIWLITGRTGTAEEEPAVPPAVNQTEQAEEGAPEPVLTVEIIQPQFMQRGQEITAEGTLVPQTEAAVSSRVSGVAIEQVLVQVGDGVNQGQPLAIFDTQVMEQQLIQAQADLQRAQTNFELAVSDVNRRAPLLEIGAVSLQEVERADANARQAEAEVVAAEARVNAETLNMRNGQVLAPVSGIISQRNASVGSLPGAEPLFVIIENGVLEWQAQLSTENASNIMVGMPVEVSLPNDQVVLGQVSRIAPTAESGTRLIDVFAILNAHPDARAGMYQRGVFQTGVEDVQTIPVSAVVTDDGYDYVMLVNAETDDQGNTYYRAVRYRVTLGERFDDQVIVLDPLPQQVAIVRQGGSFLNDGDVVRVASLNSQPA